MSGRPPVQKGVLTTSSEILAENYSRSGVVLMNLSDSTVYISFNSSAVLGSGMAILPFGGSWTMNDYTYSKESIEAISHSTSSLLGIQEFVIRA